MSLFEWFGLKRGDSRRKAAAAKELSGDLAAAVELYLQADLPDDAARVLLLRADAERAPDKRIAFCASAARTATSQELRAAALRRKALLSFDVLRARGGATLPSEVLAVARELEAAGELDRAAEAYALAGDADAEVRVLTAAGAIDKLEERLSDSMAVARDRREQAALLVKMADLDKTAERRAALELAARWLAGRTDERVAEAARAIRARLLMSRVIDLEIGGVSARYALGDEVTIGRADATLLVGSRAVSRTHVRIRRGLNGVEVEDLGTRNGTTLAGARLNAPLPVGGGVRLLLGGEVPCAIGPVVAREQSGMSGCAVDVAGERFIAPLGDLAVGPWRVGIERAGAEVFVVMKTPPGAPPPFLGEYRLAASVELCAGDAISAARGGAPIFRVPGAAPLAPAPRGSAPSGGWGERA